MDNNINILIAENKGTCINLVGKYIGGGGGGNIPTPGPGGTSNIEVIPSGSNIKPTDTNVYSALKSREEFLIKSPHEEQIVEGKVEFKDIIEFGNGFATTRFSNAGNTIYGAQLTDAGILTLNGIIANSFEVQQLIYSVVRAQGGKMVISNAATIQSCKYILKNGSVIIPNEDTNISIEDIQEVQLKFKKDEYNLGKIPFLNGDILYGFISHIGESESSARGGECIMYISSSDEEIDIANNSTDEELSMTVTAQLFAVLEENETIEDEANKVPSNIPPLGGMSVAQRGNIHGREGRMSAFFIDSMSSNLYMLDNVVHPTINKNQYAILLGQMPEDLYEVVYKAFSFAKKTDPVVYAKYGIFENFLQLDHQMKPIPTARYRGLWNSVQANSNTEYYVNSASSYDTVTHEGSLWRCMNTKTTAIPSLDVPNDWLQQVARGNDGTSIKISGSYDTQEEFEAKWKVGDVWVSPENVEGYDKDSCFIVINDLWVWDGEKWLNAGPFKGKDAGNSYVIVPSASVIYVNKKQQASVSSIDIKVGEITPNGYVFLTTLESLNSRHLYLYYTINNGDEIPLEDLNNLSISPDKETISLILKQDNPNTSTVEVINVCTIPIVKEGIDGEDPYFADIDNELDSIPLDYLGNVTKEEGETLRTNVSIWKSINQLNIINLTLTPNNIEGIPFNTPTSGGKYTGEINITLPKGTNLKSDKYTISIKVESEGISRNLTYTLNGVKAGAKGEDAIVYKLLPTDSQIIRSKENNAFKYNPEEISCTAYAEQGGVEITLNNAEIKYYIDGIDKGIYSTPIKSNTVGSQIKFVLLVNGESKDIETISLIPEGQDGISSMTNLLDNTAFKSLDKWEYAEGGTIVENQIDGLSGYYISTELSTNTLSVLAQEDTKLKKDTWYTLSFYCKGNCKLTTQFGTRTTIANTNIEGVKDGQPTSIGSLVKTDWDVTNEYVKHYVTFKSYLGLSDLATKKLSFIINKDDSIITNELYLCQIKLERSKGPTPWCLSENDKIGAEGASAISLISEPAILNIQTDSESEALINNKVHTFSVYARTVFDKLLLSDYNITLPFSVENKYTFSDISTYNDKYVFSIEFNENLKKEDLLENITISFTDKDNKDLGSLIIPTVISERGWVGPAGEGAMLLPYGNWNESLGYNLVKKGDKVIGKPCVYYKAKGADEGSYYVLEKDIPDDNSQGIKIDDENYWTPITKMKYVLAEAIMADFAKFGSDNGAVFYDRYLFSQKLQNGKSYTEDIILDGRFREGYYPKFAVDFLNGTSYISNLIEPLINKQNEKLIRINPKEGFNIFIPCEIKDIAYDGTFFSVPCNKPTVILPTLEELEDAGYTQSDINGAHITITFGTGGSKYSQILGRNKVGNESIISSQGMSSNEFLLVCVDDSFLNVEQVAGITNLFYSDSKAYALSYGYDNFFINQGKRAKYILMAPGNTLKLRPVVIDELNSINKTIHWFVESSGVYSHQISIYSTAYCIPDVDDTGLQNYRVRFHNNQSEEGYSIANGNIPTISVYTTKRMLSDSSIESNLTDDQIIAGENPGCVFVCGEPALLPHSIVLSAQKLTSSESSVSRYHFKAMFYESNGNGNDVLDMKY